MAREHKIYKSVVSSIGMVESIHTIKNNYTQCVTQEEFLSIVGNKSIFSENELLEFYKKKDIVVIKFIFNAAFGEGCNVNNATLRENGYWTTGRMHPQALDFSKEDFVTIGQLGGADVQHFITD